MYICTFLADIFERRSAYAQPPTRPAASKKHPSTHTNGSRRPRLGGPRAPTRRAGAPFFGLISILKIEKSDSRPPRRGKSRYCTLLAPNTPSCIT